MGSQEVAAKRSPAFDVAPLQCRIKEIEIMKRTTFLTLLLALVTMTGWGHEINWRIEGTVENAAPIDTLYVIDTENQKEIATINVKDGKIVPASGTLDEPAICCIAKKGMQGWIREFVLEDGTVNIGVDLKVHYLRHIGGTPMNDELKQTLALQFQRLDHETYHEKVLEEITGIISRHPDHIISPFLIESRKIIFTPTETLALIDKLSPELQKSADMDRMKENLLVEQETEVGRMFKEMKGISPDGKPTALSDYVGKGNYVLADFWASWCGPCRHEIPEVIALHEKYEEKGLKVIGITVHDSPEKSDKVVEQMRIPFPQIYESKPMSIYGVLAIPYTILFAPDGTILERGPLPVVEKKINKIFGE